MGNRGLGIVQVKEKDPPHHSRKGKETKPESLKALAVVEERRTALVTWHLG